MEHADQLQRRDAVLMSAVKFAQGGDGWSFWSIQRRGDDVRVIVSSHVEKVAGEPIILADEVIRDSIGTSAISRAIGVSSDYARRMSS